MKTQYHRLDVLDVNYYKLKAPMTVIETVELPKQTGGKGNRKHLPYSWTISKYITGAGTYRMMFHVMSYFQNVDVQNVRLTCNGKTVYTCDKLGGGGKFEKYDFKLADYDPASTYVLTAEVSNAGKLKQCRFEVCIRKSNPQLTK